MRLFCYMFQPRKTSERDKQFIYVIQTRAWIFHMLYGISRVGQWLTNNSIWQEDECIKDLTTELQDDNLQVEAEMNIKNELLLCPDYNHDLLNPIVDVVRWVIKIGIVLGLVLDIACFKYRHLANLILYYESIQYILVFLIPSKTYLELSQYVIAIFHFILFLVTYTDQGIQIVFLTVDLAFINFFILGEAYQRGLKFGAVINHTIIVILFFILCSSMAMVVAYISELHSKMATTIT